MSRENNGAKCGMLMVESGWNVYLKVKGVHKVYLFSVA